MKPSSVGLTLLGMVDITSSSIRSITVVAVTRGQQEEREQRFDLKTCGVDVETRYDVILITS
jgi:hypothetical protein